MMNDEHILYGNGKQAEAFVIHDTDGNVRQNEQKEQKTKVTISKLLGKIILKNGQAMWIGLDANDVLVGTLNEEDITQDQRDHFALDKTKMRTTDLNGLGGGGELGAIEYVIPLGVPLQDTRVNTQHDPVKGKFTDVSFSVQFPPVDDDRFFGISGKEHDLRFSLQRVLDLFRSGDIAIQSFNLQGERQARTFLILPDGENKGLGYALFFNEPRTEREQATGADQLGSLSIAAKFMESLIQGAMDTLTPKDQQKMIKIIGKLREKNIPLFKKLLAKAPGDYSGSLLRLHDVYFPEDEERSHYFSEVLKELYVLLHLDKLPTPVGALLQGGYPKMVEKLMAGNGENTMLASQQGLLERGDDGVAQLESGGGSGHNFLDGEDSPFYASDKKILDRKGNVKFKVGIIRDWMQRIVKISTASDTSFPDRERGLEKMTQMMDYVRDHEKKIAPEVETHYETKTGSILSIIIGFDGSRLLNQRGFYSIAFLRNNIDHISHVLFDEWVIKVAEIFDFSGVNKRVEDVEHAHATLLEIEASDEFRELRLGYSGFQNAILYLARIIGRARLGDGYQLNPNWVGYHRFNYVPEYHQDIPHDVG